MKKHALCATAVASLLVFAGCNNPSDTAQKSSSSSPSPSSSLVDTKPTAETVVVIVNGQPISRAFLQSIMSEMAQRGGGQSIPEDKVVDGLIARELLRQEAEKQNLAKDPTVAMKIENAAREVLVQASVENFRKNAAVTEEELKKEYDTRVATMKNVEYKARHILLETEDAAKDVLAKLAKGAKFDELAKKMSKDPSAKQNGGELGWFNPQQMVPEFSAALASLKNNDITTAPVKSQFGWHVIQREDSREQTPPPYDAVKEQFRSALVGQKLQKHVEDLKASAKIERLSLPPATPAPAPAASPQSTAPTPPPAPKPQVVAPAVQPAPTVNKPGSPAAPPVVAPAPKPAKQ
ncbi:MAG: peptidylprolyl isomerase [Proteobacteria bacterium]|nr:peptidylprolyl isomerase [Pseudomonadota bacterium]